MEAASLKRADDEQSKLSEWHACAHEPPGGPRIHPVPEWTVVLALGKPLRDLCAEDGLLSDMYDGELSALSSEGCCERIGRDTFDLSVMEPLREPKKGDERGVRIVEHALQ